MPSLTIKNMPESLYRGLEELAGRDKRSLREQILIYLGEAVNAAKPSKPAGAEITRELRHQVELLASGTKTTASDAPSSPEIDEN